MGKLIKAIIVATIAGVLSGLILQLMKGKGKRRGDAPGIAHHVASLSPEHPALARHLPIHRGSGFAPNRCQSLG
jgi:hypothetical protein